MEKLMNKFEAVLVPIAEKISQNKYLQAVNSGFIALFPVTIIGSIFYLIGNFPVISFTTWLDDIGIRNMLNGVYTITLSLVSVYMVVLIAYRLAQANEIDAVSSAVIALMCFFIITPFDRRIEDQQKITYYNFQWFDSKGLFVAIIVGLVSTSIVTWIIRKNFTIRLPEGVPPCVQKTFVSIIPAFITVTIFLSIAIIFKSTSFGNIHEFIFMFFQKPLLALGGSFGAYLIATILIQLFWWFGIHGFNLVSSVMMPIWMALDMTRLQQIQAGEAVTSYMGMSFLTAVGQGTFAVMLTIILFAKSKQLKGIAKVGIPAAIFNIGEPLVFGLPVVLNPFMFIPIVILIPVVTNVFFYLGFVSGIIPPLSGIQISMQMPEVLYGLVQGNWMLALWQLLDIPLVMLLVYPFIKMYDNHVLKDENQN